MTLDKSITDISKISWVRVSLMYGYVQLGDSGTPLSITPSAAEPNVSVLELGVGVITYVILQFVKGQSIILNQPRFKTMATCLF